MKQFLKIKDNLIYFNLPFKRSSVKKVDELNRYFIIHTDSPDWTILNLNKDDMSTNEILKFKTWCIVNGIKINGEIKELTI